MWKALTVACALVAVLVAVALPTRSATLSRRIAADEPRRGTAVVEAAEYAAGPETELAAAAFDLGTGESAGGVRADELYLTASLAKLIVAIDVLDRRRAGEITMSDDELRLLRSALGPSDDDAMNVLWVRFDGPGAARRVARSAGLAATAAPTEPSQWGDTVTTAADTARLWRHLVTMVPPPDRRLLLDAMGAAPDQARDGFAQNFGLLARGPDGQRWATAAKQGWMCCHAGRAHLHSVGLVGDVADGVVIVLLSRPPSDARWERARADLTRAAAAAVGATR